MTTVDIADLPTIRRAINDPGQFLRRHYVLTDDYGEDPKTKRFEPVGNWSARAVLVALGAIPKDEPLGPPIEVELIPGMWP